MKRNYNIDEIIKLRELSDNIANEIVKEIDGKLEIKLNNIATESKINFRNMLELEDTVNDIEKDIKYLKRLLKTNIDKTNIKKEKDIIQNINIKYNLEKQLDDINRKKVSSIIIELEKMYRDINKEYKKVLRELTKILNKELKVDNNFNEYFDAGPFVSSDERFEYSDINTKIAAMLYTLIFLSKEPRMFIDTSFEDNLNHIKEHLKNNTVDEYLVANLDNEHRNEGVSDYILEIKKLQETLENILFNFKMLNELNKLSKKGVKVPIIFHDEKIKELEKNIKKEIKNLFNKKELENILSKVETNIKEFKKIFVKTAKWDEENAEYTNIILKNKPDFEKGKKLLNEIHNNIEKSFNLIKNDSIKVINEIKQDFSVLEKLEEKIRQEQKTETNYSMDLS